MRNADIGFLYDPSRSEEAALCRHWQMQLKAGTPNFKVRRNYPYTGRSDGFTAYLRRRFHAKCYVGIELEINQNKILDGGRDWRALRLGVIDALGRAMKNFSA